MSESTETLLGNSAGSFSSPPSTLSPGPTCMWIGCCDARVVPEGVLRRQHGDVFTHRNISNLFQVDDTNVQAALSFAMSDKNRPLVEVFLVGHTDCGGAQASYDAAHRNIPVPGPLGRWLEPLIELSRREGSNVEPDELVIKNVQEQFNKLVQSNAFRSAERIVSARGPLYNVRMKDLDPLVHLDRTNRAMSEFPNNL